MPHSTAPIELPELGVMRIRGADGARFLQGQLSNDLTRLAPGATLLAGYHNPQGRAIAILRLVQRAEDDILAVLPRELVATVAGRLERFILRAKARLSDESARLRVLGAVDESAPAAEAARLTESPGRWLLVSERSAAAVSTEQAAEARARWRRWDVACGLPQVYASTSEAFLAQMLNLDLLEAIAFAKGCYTGQEVIARAHYRGRVKRRMQRFRTLAPRALAAGESGVLADGRGFKVVEVAPLPDGRAEFLAVAALAPPAAEGAEAAEVSEGAADAAEPPPVGAAEPRLEAEPLALPYALPR
ncbi:MAG TPA: hypothetical protein VMU67_03020 [Steroidobacteraceae bacterium]|nr:hypothetical protein [Steroidobacteraceae bacterium]